MRLEDRLLSEELIYQELIRGLIKTPPKTRHRVLNDDHDSTPELRHISARIVSISLDSWEFSASWASAYRWCVGEDMLLTYVRKSDVQSPMMFAVGRIGSNEPTYTHADCSAKELYEWLVAIQVAEIV